MVIFNQGVLNSVNYIEKTIDEFEKLDPLEEQQVPLGYLKRCIAQKAVICKGALRYLFLPAEGGEEYHTNPYLNFDEIIKPLVKRKYIGI